mgnify:CR=1 FL=1
MYRLFLLTAAFFWGCAFVAQRMSTGAIGAFGFNGMRFLLGALCVMPVIIWPVSYTHLTLPTIA